tara:strand:- start:15 stop:350 length:336 start_codon:yes stop_codon:yes gene_type:complete
MDTQYVQKYFNIIKNNFNNYIRLLDLLYITDYYIKNIIPEEYKFAFKPIYKGEYIDQLDITWNITNYGMICCTSFLNKYRPRKIYCTGLLKKQQKYIRNWRLKKNYYLINR